VRANQRHFGGKNVMLSSFSYEVLQKCCGDETSREDGSSFGIFDQQKGLVTSNKNNWATYTANKD